MILAMSTIAPTYGLKILPRQTCGTYRSDQIRRWTRRKGGYHGLRVPIIQHKFIGMLHQAGSLLLRGLVEASLIHFNVQRAGQRFRSLLKRFRLAIGNLLDLAQVSVEP